MPTTIDDWSEVVNGFDQRRDYPACLGSVDRKHIRICKPKGVGSHFYNYKNYHSLVLLGVANSNYEFIYAKVGMEGSMSDSTPASGRVWFQVYSKYPNHIYCVEQVEVKCLANF